MGIAAAGKWVTILLVLPKQNKTPYKAALNLAPKAPEHELFLFAYTRHDIFQETSMLTTNLGGDASHQVRRNFGFSLGSY